MAVKRADPPSEDFTDPGHQPDFDPPEHEEDQTPETVVPATEIDVQRALRLLRAVRTVLLGNIGSFLLPIPLLAVQGLLDGAVSGRAWWLLVLAGFARGLVFTALFEWAARVVEPSRPRFQGLTWVGPVLVGSSTLLSWNMTGGLLCLTLLFVPWADASLARASPFDGVRLTASVLGKSALTWLAAQAALMLLGLLAWLLVSAVGDALVGELLSGVLSGVVLAPLVHGWLVLRAVWARD